jgi:hypothetical protein
MWRLTTEDIINLNKVAIGRVAEVLNIETDNKTFTEVFSEISDTNDPLFNVLDNFIALYRQYQNQIEDMDAKEFRGQNITNADRDELSRRIELRNNSRRTLIEAIEARINL